MESLYSKDIINPDTDSFLDRLRKSDINDVSIENEIILVMENMILSIDEVKDETEASLVMMNMFSGDTLSLNRRYISATTTPSISATRLRLSTNSDDNVSGVIGTSNAIAIYRDDFWRRGGNVDIKNKAFSTYGLVDFLDVMLTYDIGKSIFLGRSPNEVLDECYVSARSGSISSSELESIDVVCFSDTARTYHEHNKTIDTNVNSLATIHSSISGSSLSSSSSAVSIKNLSYLHANSGLIIDSDIGGYFIGNDTTISNQAIVPRGDSNISSVEGVSIHMAKHNAPKIGWKQSNVTRDGSINTDELTELTRAILDGTDINNKDRPIIFSDINSVLTAVGNEILGMEKCV